MSGGRKRAAPSTFPCSTSAIASLTRSRGRVSQAIVDVPSRGAQRSAKSTRSPPEKPWLGCRCLVTLMHQEPQGCGVPVPIGQTYPLAQVSCHAVPARAVPQQAPDQGAISWQVVRRGAAPRPAPF